MEEIFLLEAVQWCWLPLIYQPHISPSQKKNKLLLHVPPSNKLHFIRKTDLNRNCNYCLYAVTHIKLFLMSGQDDDLYCGKIQFVTSLHEVNTEGAW